MQSCQHAIQKNLFFTLTGSRIEPKSALGLLLKGNIYYTLFIRLFIFKWYIKILLDSMRPACSAGQYWARNSWKKKGNRKKRKVFCCFLRLWMVTISSSKPCCGMRCFCFEALQLSVVSSAPSRLKEKGLPVRAGVQTSIVFEDRLSCVMSQKLGLNVCCWSCQSYLPNHCLDNQGLRNKI